MITLGILKEKNKVKTLFDENKIEYSQHSKCVAAKSGEEMFGFCLFDMDNERIVIRYIEPLDDISLADGILRSTLHVAAERSIMNAFYADTVPEDFLNKIGFIKDNKEKSLDIDKLFKSCCSCN